MSSLHLHSSSNAIIFFEQTPNQLLELQQFLGVTLVSFIFGDNLHCHAGRLSSSFASNSSIPQGPVTMCALQTHKSHTVYVNKLQNIRGLSLHQPMGNM